MEEKQKLTTDLINFFAEQLKHHKIEKEKRKLLEVQKHFTFAEELFNSISHGVGALLSIAGLVLLLVWVEGAKQVTGVTIFASSAIFFYTMSTIYHAFPKGRTKRIFERLDSASMYVLIAGSYTPIYFIILDNLPLGWVLFGIQWGLTLIGVVLKAIWVDRLDIIHLIIFLLMVCLIIIFVGPLLHSMPVLAFIFLLIGTLCYSIGILFYIFSWFKFHHGLWHLFILAGTIMHFFSMWAILFY